MMQKQLALTIVTVLILTAPAYSEEYLLTVSLEAFARPSSMSLPELARLMTKPRELLKVLKPDKKVFRQSIQVSTDKSFLQEVELGDISIKTEGSIQSKAGNHFPVTISSKYVKQVKKANGLPINSIVHGSGSYQCVLGQKLIIGQVRPMGSIEVTALTLQIDKIKQRERTP